jgi:hypothetical protein
MREETNCFDTDYLEERFSVIPIPAKPERYPFDQKGSTTRKAVLAVKCNDLTYRAKDDLSNLPSTNY